MAKLDKIIEQIRALQAKAQDKSCTEAESASFAAKVSELLTKYNLDQKDLEKGTTTQELIESEILERNFVHPWRPILAQSVANLYFCRSLIITLSPTSKYTNAKKRLMFIGKAHNRAVAISMFSHFETTIHRLATEKYTRKSEIDTFERSCGLHLSDRIFEIYSNLQRPAPSGDRSVPVLFKSEKDLVDEFTQKQYSPRIGKKTKFQLDGEAARDGRIAARQIPVQTQIG